MRSSRRGRCDWARASASWCFRCVILLTKSRGAFLGFAVFLLFALWGQRRRGRAIGVTMVVAAALIFVAPENVLDRVFALRKIETTANLAAADKEGSAEQRYEIWKVSRQIIRENPVIGVGLGAYPAVHLRVSRQPQFNTHRMGAARQPQHLPERDGRDGVHRTLHLGVHVPRGIHRDRPSHDES